MTAPILRDPCNLATALPTADPDLAAQGAASHTPAADLAAHEALTAVHLGVDLIEMGAEDIAAAGGAAGHAAEVLHRFCEIAGLPIAVVAHYRDFYLGIVCAARDGGAAGMLAQAMGGDELNRPSPGRQAAFAAILAGINGPETGPILAQLPPSQHADFRAAYADMAERSASGDPNFRVQLREARAQFAEITREFGAGVTAALEGWADDDRSAAFDSGHAFAIQWMRANPTEAPRARQVARANKTDGFVARANGQVDARRMESDPSYRSGVNRAERRIEEVGPDAVRLEARELQRSRGVPVRGSAQCRVQG